MLLGCGPSVDCLLGEFFSLKNHLHWSPHPATHPLLFISSECDTFLLPVAFIPQLPAVFISCPFDSLTFAPSLLPRYLISVTHGSPRCCRNVTPLLKSSRYQSFPHHAVPVCPISSLARMLSPPLSPALDFCSPIISQGNTRLACCVTGKV